LLCAAARHLWFIGVAAAPRLRSYADVLLFCLSLTLLMLFSPDAACFAATPIVTASHDAADATPLCRYAAYALCRVAAMRVVARYALRRRRASATLRVSNEQRLHLLPAPWPMLPAMQQPR